MIELAINALQLKERQRTGWVLRGVDDPESVADHSWGTAFLSLLYADQAGVDVTEAVTIAEVHDLAESVTGDIATRVVSMSDPGIADGKRKREREAMEGLTGGFDENVRSRVLEVWEEYEEARTGVARFVRDMNLIDMCIQAFIYQRDERCLAGDGKENFPDFDGMDEFFATTAPRISTEVGATLFGEILDLYNKLPGVAHRGGFQLKP